MGDALEVPHLLPEVNLFGTLLSFPTTGDGQLCFSSGYSLLGNWDGVVRVELLWDGRLQLIVIYGKISVKIFCILIIPFD